MDLHAIVTICSVSLAAILFVSGKVRMDLVAVGLLLVLILFGVLSPDEALSGFSNPVVIMMVGLFIVGAGIFQTGLAKIVSGKLLQLAGTHETRLLIMVMLVTSMFGAFVSNTGTVAVMMPIVVSLALGAGINPGRLLMPLAYASTLGGMLTVIGTPPNLIVSQTLVAAGYEGLSLFSFTPVGMVCVATGIFSMLVLRRFLPRNEPGDTARQSSPIQELFRKYRLEHYIYRLEVPEGGSICFHTVRDLDLPNRFGLGLLEVRRRLTVRDQILKTFNQEIAGPDTVIQGGDTLFVYGPYERAQEFAEKCGLRLLDRPGQESAVLPRDRYIVTDTVGIAEVMLTPHSRFIGRAIKDSGFRENFRLNVLGIQRGDEFILHNLKDEKMRFGDALLVQGAWKDIELLAAEDDVVVIGQSPEELLRQVTLDWKAPIAAGVMLLMIGLLVTELVPAVAAILVAAALMVGFGCVRNMDEAYRAVNWESVVLIGAMIPLSIAIEKTGAAAWLSSGLVAALGPSGPLALLAGVYVATSILTMFISNTAAAVLLAPIALDTAVQAGVSPVPFMFAVAVGASMCFASPFATPPNALVMSAGRYTFMHYIKVGLPLQVIMAVVMLAVLPVLFPF